MSKEIKAKIKLQIPGGAATPAPPVGSSLGQQGANIMEFCKHSMLRQRAEKAKQYRVKLSFIKINHSPLPLISACF